MSLDIDLVIIKKPACEHCGRKMETETVYDTNITHNLGLMAEKAGIYQHLWRPEELGITQAKELVIPLQKGLDDLYARPEYFEQFNSPNGWGSYVHFVPFVSKYLAACIENPEAIIEVGR